ncbi:MAG TPA: invasion associated locus B family protein, partial [Rhizomicrobium sp.]
MKITTDTLIGAACALVLGLLLGWAGRGLLTFPSSSATDTVYKNWRLICSAPSQKDSNCQMSEDIAAPNNPQQEVARLAIGKNRGKLVMAVTLPLEVTLESGVSLTFGATQSKYYNYNTCIQVGCLVLLPLDDKLMSAMLQAKNAKLIF